MDLTAYGAVGGAFWGPLIGLIFLNALLGTAPGVIAGAAVSKISDYGIDDAFMKQLAANMAPGRSAIFMLVRRATVDKVEPEIARFGGHLLYTNLSKAAEARVEALLAQATPSGASGREPTNESGVPMSRLPA